MPEKISQFWQEIKRRKVLRVITVYAAVAFVILQLVEILAPSLRLPEWTMNLILVLLIVGFVIAVIGEPESAMAIIEDLLKLSESRFVSKVYFANIYFALGDREATLKYMELALLERDWRIHAFQDHTSMNLIKREPWLQDLIDRSWIPLTE